MQAFIICDQERTRSRVQQVLLQNGVECPAANVLPLDRALERLPQVDLIVLVLSPDPERALRILTQLRLLTKALLVGVGPATEARLVLQTLRLGASDYVDEADLVNELAAALEHLQNEMMPRSPPGQVIALLASSGGTGSSTLAVNIATVLAREHTRALLVDLKLETGDLAALLNLRPMHSLAHICQNLTQMDRVMFERSLTDHSSGIKLLAAPPSFAQVSDVTGEGVGQALSLGRSLFPYVVLDLDHSFREEQLQALGLADVILVVLRLDFASLRNTKRILEYITQLGIGSERLRVVVNRYGQPKELPAAKAEEALGVKIFHFVPEDPKTVNRANNQGVAAVLEYPTSRFAKSVSKLAFSVNGATGATKASQ